jgi:uncharacterized membrane protein (GlpM family)
VSEFSFVIFGLLFVVFTFLMFILFDSSKGKVIPAALAAVLAFFAKSAPCLVIDAAPFAPSLAMIVDAACATRRNPFATRIQLAADMMTLESLFISIYTSKIFCGRIKVNRYTLHVW